jgi:ankyrin repeat protein
MSPLTDLLAAIRRDDAEGVRRLATLDVVNALAPDGDDDDGESLVSLAVVGGHFAAAQALVDAGANVDTPDDVDCTPLATALMTGNAAGARWLLAHGAIASGSGDEAPLWHAIEAASGQGADWLALLDELLDHGASASMASEEGMTAMHLAATCEMPAVVELLARHGAEVDARDESGETPLEWLVRRRRAFDDSDANPASDIPDEWPDTVRLERTVRALVVAGARLDQPNPAGVLPIELARRAKLPEALLALVRPPGYRRPTSDLLRPAMVTALLSNAVAGLTALVASLEGPEFDAADPRLVALVVALQGLGTVGASLGLLVLGGVFERRARHPRGSFAPPALLLVGVVLAAPVLLGLDGLARAVTFGVTLVATGPLLVALLVSLSPESQGSSDGMR